jgi:hypothetical protein
VGCPVKRHLLQLLHVEFGNNQRTLWTHSHITGLFTELTTKAEERGNQYMVEEPQNVTLEGPRPP